MWLHGYNMMHLKCTKAGDVATQRYKVEDESRAGQ